MARFLLIKKLFQDAYDACLACINCYWTVVPHCILRSLLDFMYETTLSLIYVFSFLIISNLTHSLTHGSFNTLLWNKYQTKYICQQLFCLINCWNLKILWFGICTQNIMKLVCLKSQKKQETLVVLSNIKLTQLYMTTVYIHIFFFFFLQQLVIPMNYFGTLWEVTGPYWVSLFIFFLYVRQCKTKKSIRL